MPFDAPINTKLDKKETAPQELEQAPDVKKEESLITVEQGKLTELLKSKDFGRIIEQIYKIAMILHRMGHKEDKSYMLDKEVEMHVEIKKIKDSYNSWGVLIITIISGGLQIAGGAVGIFAAFPGTAAGNLLGRIMPFFNNADAVTKINGVSSAISGIGQGSGTLGKIFENKDEAKRALLQFYLQQMQRKHEERSRSSSEEAQNSKEAMRNLQEACRQAYEAARGVIDVR